MTDPAPPAEPLPERPTALWGVFAAALVVFLVTWGLTWANAYGLNDDLPNVCRDAHRQSFPPEVSCRNGDGTTTGANAAWAEALFFASFGVAVLVGALAAALTLTVGGRGRR
ncbi:hypothetical protein AB0903_00190 [Streptomyces sp. NPDC048389]|uniref:hypothetical protein n=1 Tax=Streptomyces sp. NPDC048389 TaxID=3154622 RepID=UPI00345636F4